MENTEVAEGADLEEFLRAEAERPGPRVGPARRRMAIALLLSLLAHLPLLALTFGGDGMGLPGFVLPWQARRIAAPDLRVFLLPARVAPEQPAVAPAIEPALPESGEPPVVDARASAPRAPPDAKRSGTTVSILAEADAASDPVVGPVPAKPTEPAEPSRDGAPAPVAVPDLIALTRPNRNTWVLPAPPEVLAPVLVEEPVAPAVKKAPPVRDAEVVAQARSEQAARERAAEQARAERAREEARRQEEQAAARQEAARQEAARQEAARQEAARQEAARLEAARQEALRQDAARRDAARAEVARQEAERQEAAARREAVLRAIGRQLDEEAARRKAAEESRLPLSLGSARRARLFGRTDPNAALARYAQSWEQKIQMNMTFDMVREAAKRPHTQPVVTVAVRKDGSVESVTFVVSSGAAELDEAIRRVVRSQENYPAFPAELAREYDVIEIRRTWHFDMAIRLY